MKCPTCSTEGAYQGLLVVECSNGDCVHYKQPKEPKNIQEAVEYFRVLYSKPYSDGLANVLKEPYPEYEPPLYDNEKPYLDVLRDLNEDHLNNGLELLNKYPPFMSIPKDVREGLVGAWKAGKAAAYRPLRAMERLQQVAEDTAVRWGVDAAVNKDPNSAGYFVRFSAGGWGIVVVAVTYSEAESLRDTWTPEQNALSVKFRQAIQQYAL